jgi:hypothetical protein
MSTGKPYGLAFRTGEEFMQNGEWRFLPDGRFVRVGTNRAVYLFSLPTVEAAKN